VEDGIRNEGGPGFGPGVFLQKKSPGKPGLFGRQRICQILLTFAA